MASPLVDAVTLGAISYDDADGQSLHARPRTAARHSSFTGASSTTYQALSIFGSGEAPSSMRSASSSSSLSQEWTQKSLTESATRMQEDLDVPHHLHCYAPYAHALVLELESRRDQLDAEITQRTVATASAAAHAAAGVAGSSGTEVPDAVPAATEAAATATIELPSLHWDTSVLDMEEDRVIWVRESDLGKTTLIEP